MNKLTIPAILVATVMVAGAFAFMPVEQASTVHTTIAGTIQAIDSTPAGFDQDEGGTITLDTSQSAILQALVCNYDDGAGGGVIDFDAVTVDGEDLSQLLGTDLVQNALIPDGGITLSNLGIAFEDIIVITTGVNADGNDEVLDCTAIVQSASGAIITLVLAD